MAMTISEQNYINQAINRARGAYNNAIETSRRNAERMGVNPNSGKFSAMDQSAQFASAAASAAAGNEASTSWLNTAQAQANQDEAMRYKYAALDLENRGLEHRMWKDREDFKVARHTAEGYDAEERRDVDKTAQYEKFGYGIQGYEARDHLGTPDDKSNHGYYKYGDGVFLFQNEGEAKSAMERHNIIMKKENKKDKIFDDVDEYAKWLADKRTKEKRISGYRY